MSEPFIELVMTSAPRGLLVDLKVSGKKDEPKALKLSVVMSDGAIFDIVTGGYEEIYAQACADSHQGELDFSEGGEG